MPRADDLAADRSLSDWPKPASLLPPLTPSPGAVDFGEVYLTWSDEGLQLATIGQDYYDLDLLAYDGAFRSARPTASRSASTPAPGRGA